MKAETDCGGVVRTGYALKCARGGCVFSIPSHHAVRTRHESNAAHGRTRDHQADQPASTCA